jgi:hypothetical protein
MVAYWDPIPACNGYAICITCDDGDGDHITYIVQLTRHEYTVLVHACVHLKCLWFFLSTEIGDSWQQQATSRQMYDVYVTTVSLSLK